MTREDKRWVISICRMLADKMDDSGKVAVEQVISAVESIEEQGPRWISVSERLPSDCDMDWVLVQIQEDNGYLWIPCVAEYRKQIDDWLVPTHDVGWLKNHNGVFKVVVWMPLPEPYKAESEEDEQ